MKRLVIWISSCLVGVPLCWGALQVVATPVLNADGLETAFTLTVEAEEGRYLALAWDESDRGDSSFRAPRRKGSCVGPTRARVRARTSATAWFSSRVVL